MSTLLLTGRSMRAQPKEPATLDQFKFYDKLCELSQENGLETDAIPNNATRNEAQQRIDLREMWLMQCDPQGLAILHEKYVWSEEQDEQD